jgi:PAS domain S-box-containing protein
MLKELQSLRRRISESIVLDPFQLSVQSLQGYAMFILDPAGTIVSWNSGAVRILRYAREEVLGKFIGYFYVPEDVARGQPEQDLQVALAEDRHEAEGKRVRKDGTEFWAFTTTTALRSEGHVGFSVVIRDITERRRSEDMQRAAETPYRLMVEGVADCAIYMVNREGRVCSWNIGAERLNGYSPEEIIGQHYSRFFISEDAKNDVPKQDLVRAATNGKTVEERWQTRKDGSRFWSHGILTALYDSVGELIGFCNIVRDMTEHRQIEVLLRSVLENVIDGIISLDEHGTIETFNHAAEKIFGYSQTEILGRNVSILMPSLNEEKRDGYLRAYMRDGAATSIGCGREVEGRRKNGSLFPVDLAASEFLMEIDGRCHFTGIVGDISHRTKGEETRAILTAVFEATPDFVGIADAADGHFLFLNQAARRLFGLGDEEDLSAVRLEDFHPSSMMEALTSYRIPSALQNGSWSGESTVLNKEGRKIPVSQVIVAHKSPAGNVRFISTVMRDLTEQKKLEHQLRQAQKMEAIGELAGGLSHDFNNLLTVISGYSELVLSELSSEDAMRQSIQAISDAGARGASLTRQLLAFSRQTVSEPKVLNLNEAVRETESMLRRLIGDDVLLTTVLDPCIKCVRIDPALLGQVLMNLAVNARDAMPKGGSLKIETGSLNWDPNYPEIHSGKYVVLTTTDNGSGMTPEVSARIFEPFFTTKAVGKGTGLGLAVVYGIIKQSHGHIEVHSDLGLGTIFKIYLPAVEDQPPTADGVEANEPVNGSETILLVEDEEAVRELALVVFRSCGYQVLAASDGRSAMQVAQEFHGAIDLLVTDVVMPGMNGGELADALRWTFPKMKVLYASGSMDDAVVRCGILRTEVCFLQKPYTPLSLTRKVRAVLDMSS